VKAFGAVVAIALALALQTMLDRYADYIARVQR